MTKDHEDALRKVKYLEKENSDLRLKVSEMAERLGKEESDLDERERLIFIDKIEREIENEISKDLGDEVEEEEDVNQISDKRILKEEDQYTDMKDFDEYLRSINAERFKDAETGMDKIGKRHMKIGVNAKKLGHTKEKETFIDPRIIPQGIQVNAVDQASD